MKKKATKPPPPKSQFHGPLANGIDLSIPPMFGGTAPIQTQGVKTPPLGIGNVTGVAKPRK